MQGIWREDLSPLQDLLRVAIYDFKIMISDTGSQKNGLVAILDFKNFGMSKMKDMTPVFLKKLALLLQVFYLVSLYSLETAFFKKGFGSYYHRAHFR